MATILRGLQWAALIATLSMLASEARADFQVCNRISYVIEAAVGLEDKRAIARRGWLRIDPGACRMVLQGDVQAEGFYLYARTLPIYGISPLPQTGHADLCINQEDFTLPNARACTRPGQRLVR